MWIRFEIGEMHCLRIPFSALSETFLRLLLGFRSHCRQAGINRLYIPSVIGKCILGAQEQIAIEKTLGPKSPAAFKLSISASSIGADAENCALRRRGQNASNPNMRRHLTSAR